MSDKTKIYLKGGQVLEIKTESFTATRNGNNELTGLEWKLTDKDQKILYIRLDDISAIVSGG